MQEPNVFYNLPPAQDKVIAAINGGATMQAAAQAAGIHRNTISYWRRTSALFRDALNQAQYDKALFIREEAETHVADAFALLHSILTDPNASDSARVNAAKYIIEKATTPPPPIPEVVYQFESCAKPENVNSPAQSESPTGAPQTVRTSPKVGRNEPCPCGSNLKYKRCCIGRPNLAAAA